MKALIFTLLFLVIPRGYSQLKLSLGTSPNYMAGFSHIEKQGGVDLLVSFDGGENIEKDLGQRYGTAPDGFTFMFELDCYYYLKNIEKPGGSLYLGVGFGQALTSISWEDAGFRELDGELSYIPLFAGYGHRLNKNILFDVRGGYRIVGDMILKYTMDNIDSGETSGDIRINSGNVMPPLYLSADIRVDFK